jgi:hypothetical protein
MPTFDQHFEQANRNRKFLDTFFLKDHHDWAMTVMFYTSLHLVEALMYKEVNRLRGEDKWGYLEIDCSNHDERERQVKEIMNDIHFPFTQLKKFADSGRYKVYVFRPNEITSAYMHQFKPVVDYFNNYCRKYTVKAEFKLSPQKINLTKLP